MAYTLSRGKGAYRLTILPWFWSTLKWCAHFHNTLLFMLCKHRRLTLPTHSTNCHDRQLKTDKWMRKMEFLIEFHNHDIYMAYIFLTMPSHHHPPNSVSENVLCHNFFTDFVILHHHCHRRRHHHVDTCRIELDSPSFTDRISTNCNLLHITRDIGWFVYASPRTEDMLMKKNRPTTIVSWYYLYGVFVFNMCSFFARTISGRWCYDCEWYKRNVFQLCCATIR